MDTERHWETIWADRDPEEVSWFQPSADVASTDLACPRGGLIQQPPQRLHHRSRRAGGTTGAHHPMPPARDAHDTHAGFMVLVEQGNTIEAAFTVASDRQGTPKVPDTQSPKALPFEIGEPSHRATIDPDTRRLR